MMNFTLRQLAVFVEIARRGTLSAAAEEMLLTQSAASMSLKELEKGLGGPLFNRIGRGLVLNDRGRLLLRKAEALLGEARELAELTRDDGAALAGTLHLGCSTTIASYDLPRRIKAFHESHPQAEIVLRVGNTKEVAQHLRTGEIDLGLVEGDLIRQDLTEEDWQRDELVVIAAPGHPLAGRKRVTRSELGNELWIMREEGSGTLSTLAGALADNKVRPRRMHRIGHTEAIKRAVEAGMGISALSHIAVAREIADGHLTILPVPFTIARWFRIITYPGRYQSRLVRHVLDWLRGPMDRAT